MLSPTFVPVPATRIWVDPRRVAVVAVVATTRPAGHGGPHGETHTVTVTVDSSGGGVPLRGVDVVDRNEAMAMAADLVRGCGDRFVRVGGSAQWVNLDRVCVVAVHARPLGPGGPVHELEVRCDTTAGLAVLRWQNPDESEVLDAARRILDQLHERRLHPGR